MINFYMPSHACSYISKLWFTTLLSLLGFLHGRHKYISSAIEWSLAKLINHPTVLEKARMDIDKVVGNNRLVVESNYPRLPYIQAIIKETLRLHPPIPLISRKSMKECNINERMLGTLEGTPSLGKIQWN